MACIRVFIGSSTLCESSDPIELIKTDEELKIQLRDALRIEDYEDCQEIKNELEQRKIAQIKGAKQINSKI